MNEPLPGFYGKRFLTTYLTITGFGAHGDSGDKSFKEQLFWNKWCQKGVEIVRKKFQEVFGTRMPRVRVLPLGPKVQIPPYGVWAFSHLCIKTIYQKSLIWLPYYVQLVYCYSVIVEKEIVLW